MFKRYVYGNNPELLPLSEDSFWDEKKIIEAGFNPDDDEIICCELTEDWNDHATGSIVVTGFTVTGHSFAVEI